MSKPTIISRAGISAEINKVERKGNKWSCAIEIDGEITTTYHSLKRDAVGYANTWMVGREPVIATGKVKRVRKVTPRQADPVVEVVVAPVVVEIESWDWIRGNGIDFPEIEPAPQVDHAAAMVSQMKQISAPKISHLELIAAAILFIMLVVGLSMAAPMIATFALAAVPVIKLAGVSVATAMIGLSLL